MDATQRCGDLSSDFSSDHVTQRTKASKEKAIAFDPDYARAYAGLADTYALMASYSLGDEFIPRARAAALHALELDDQLAEAHTSLALIVENHDWDWEMAEQEYRRAIELDPNYVTAHHWYGEFLGFQGRFDEDLLVDSLGHVRLLER